MAVITISTEADFRQYLTNDKVIIDWSAKWCAPCKAIAPIYEKLAQRYPNIIFLKIDTDDFASLTREFQVTAMPTFQLYTKGLLFISIRGANVPVLERQLDTLDKYEFV